MNFDIFVLLFLEVNFDYDLRDVFIEQKLGRVKI